MNRQEFTNRLRAWAARADHESVESHGEGKAAWQGQATVLHAVANIAAGGHTEQNSPLTIRKQLIEDRGKTLTVWDKETDPAAAAELTGQVQGYDLVLELLKGAGDQWAA